MRKGDNLRLDLGPDVEVDAITFDGLCRQARKLHRPGERGALLVVDGQALALWRGCFFEELPYLDWLDWRRQEMDADYYWLQEICRQPAT